MSATGETSGRTEGRRRAAVMTDVAKLAGVSHQTVSRVLNGSPQVRPATRERVLVAMQELDYRPNSAARALVTGRSRTLGVVSFDTTLYGPASTLYAIERAAHDAGYFITIVSLEALDRASVLSAVERLRMQGVDGILVIAPLEGAGDALVAPAARRPARGGRGRPRGRAAGRRRRPVRRRGARHPPPARARPSDRRPHRGPRPTSSRPPSASTAGGPRWRPPAPTCRRSWSATGARARATSWAGAWCGRTASARSSSPTTRWRSACCGRCTRRASRSRGRSAWSGSTTSPRRSTTPRR